MYLLILKNLKKSINMVYGMGIEKEFISFRKFFLINNVDGLVK